MTATRYLPHTGASNGAAPTMHAEDELGETGDLQQQPSEEQSSKRTSGISIGSKETKPKSPKKRRKVNHGTKRMLAC